MSVPARCIAIGVLVFLYWVAAFLVAVMDVFSADGWWNAGWLREPGYRLGVPIVGFLEVCLRGHYAGFLGWPHYIALFITSVGMGTGAWLLSALVSGWWLRRKRS